MLVSIANYIINTDHITDIVRNLGRDNDNQVYLSNGRSYILSNSDLKHLLNTANLKLS